MPKPTGLGNRYLEITIDSDGKTHLEVHGVKDQTCRTATQGIEVILGVPVQRTTKKPPDPQQTVKS